MEHIFSCSKANNDSKENEMGWKTGEINTRTMRHEIKQNKNKVLCWNGHETIKPSK